MKIYDRIVMDWDGVVLEEQSHEYDGPVAMCGGGGKTKAKVTPAPPAPEPVKSEPGKTGVSAARDDAKKKAQQAAGLSGTNVTGGALSGATVNTTKKSLMGQ
jgi:hypothetical protein